MKAQKRNNYRRNSRSRSVNGGNQGKTTGPNNVIKSGRRNNSRHGSDIPTHGCDRSAYVDKNPNSLADSINAEKFVPRQKLEQWDKLPHIISEVFPSRDMHSNPALLSWIHDPLLKRSRFDYSVFNLLQYLPLPSEEAIAFIYHSRSKHTTITAMYPYLSHTEQVRYLLNQNLNTVLALRKKLEYLEQQKLEGCSPATNWNNISDNLPGRSPCGGILNEERALQTTAESVAKSCDNIRDIIVEGSQSPQNSSFVDDKLMEVFGKHMLICRNYVTRMIMLLDIERIRSNEEIKRYDIYSCKFESIEIAPPVVPCIKCKICSGDTTLNPSSKKEMKGICGYHLAISCHDDFKGFESALNLQRGRGLLSRITCKRQFQRLNRILRSLWQVGERLVARIAIPGVAENRPMLSIGDSVRFRFSRNGCSCEVLGEVAEVHIKSEIVTLFLPPPLYDTNNLKNNPSFPYVEALMSPKNLTPVRVADKHIGRFDVRFGQFGSRGFDIFQKSLCDAIHSKPSGICRVIAPTPLLKGIVKRSHRKECSEINEWVNPVNEEQKKAVYDIVHCYHGRAPYIVFGPPGTGKTLTVVESVIQVLRMNPSAKIMICAPSDAACDVLAKRIRPVLSSMNVDKSETHQMLRINWWSRIPASLPPELLSCTPSNNAGFFAVPSSSDIKEASVVVCQCFVAGCLGLGSSENDWMQKHFTHLFVDESSQSLECEALVPILSVGDDCSIVLVGDPKQLSPTVRDNVAARAGLSLSLQERLMGLPLYKDNKHCVMTTLLANYRSHDALLKIPSELFYNGRLQCQASPEISAACKDFELLEDGENFPLMVYNVSKGKEMSKLDTPSYYNLVECEAVAKLIEALILSENVNIHTGEIAVITCFRAQVLKLREVLRSRKLSNVNVGVVEDFQGQEQKVVIISTVLTQKQDRWSSLTGGLGFMTDPKRFNVAITRASALCVIVGHVGFLEESGTYWTALIDYVRHNYGLSGDTNEDVEDHYDHEEEYGISHFIQRVEELHLLGSGHEEDRYELAMRGYYQDAPEWKIILS